MYLKLVGAGLIIFAAYFMGCQVCSLYQRRVRYLEEIIFALEMFQAEVKYGLTPLPQAFQKIGRKMKQPVGSLFGDFSANLLQGRGLSALECWKSALAKRGPELALTAEQMELLERLGSAWGQGDKDGQGRQISFMQEVLRHALDGARKERQKNDKLFRYLGLLGGVTVVLFLL
jgi:stage III sporulation protein AB